MATTSLTKALTSGRCPRCRRGHLFTYNSWWPTRFWIQNTNCEHCNLKFELEPAFFIGARYISYAIMVAIVGVLFTATLVLAHDPPLSVYLYVVLPPLILLAPGVQRASQILYLYMFGWVKYEPALDKPEADLGE